SPVPAFGRGASLRAFGTELRESAGLRLEPGASIDLLPPAMQPRDLDWASPSPRIADCLSRWAQVVDRYAADVLDPGTIAHVRNRLAVWHGGHPPASRAWVEADLEGLFGKQRDLARIAILVAKASYQIDDKLLQAVVDQGASEADLVKLGAFGAFSGARRVAAWVAGAAVPEPQIRIAVSAL
ncbi:hypothetical protein, partial [Roseibium sp.]|uniref:hypothetical protein n=1 Tax=Roseibium sp. TaxID=1936156 RepID=UPI003D0DD3DD